MKTLMRNGRDRRSENPLLGHARRERVVLIGTDQRITSGPAAKRSHSKAEYMTAPERFADRQIPLAPRAPSIHDSILRPMLSGPCKTAGEHADAGDGDPRLRAGDSGFEVLGEAAATAEPGEGCAPP